MNDSHTPDHRQQAQPWPTWLPWLVLIAIGFFLLRGRLAAPPTITDHRTTPAREPLEATFVNNNQNRVALAAARPRDVAIPAELGGQEQATIALFRKCSQSTVFIRTRAEHQFNTHRVAEGTGTGFVWDAEGRIVTNFHVVEGATKLFVTLADQTQYPAEFLGADPGHDLALLQINAPREKLAPLPIGTSKDLLLSLIHISEPTRLESKSRMPGCG